MPASDKAKTKLRRLSTADGTQVEAASWIQDFFELLASSSSIEPLRVPIPDTIVFKYRRPVAWYRWSAESQSLLKLGAAAECHAAICNSGLSGWTRASAPAPYPPPPASAPKAPSSPTRQLETRPAATLAELWPRRRERRFQDIFSMRSSACRAARPECSRCHSRRRGAPRQHRRELPPEAPRRQGRRLRRRECGRSDPRPIHPWSRRGAKQPLLALAALRHRRRGALLGELWPPRGQRSAPAFSRGP